MQRTVILLLLSLILLSSCSSIGAGIKKYDLSKADLDIITEKLNENYSNVRSISGRFDFSYSTESDRKQSSGYIYLQKNDTLYIEIKGLVGETEAILFIDKDSVKAVNYYEKIIIRDKSDEKSIRRITGMKFDVSDLRNSLLNNSQNSKILKVVNVESDHIVIRIQLSETEYQFVTLNENLLISQIDEYEEREIKFTKQYDYFTNENGHYLPRRIRIKTFNPPAKLTLFYTDMIVNENKIFDIKVSL